MHPTPMGAINQLWAGTSSDAVDLNGKVRDETMSVASADLVIASTSYPGLGWAFLAKHLKTLLLAKGCGILWSNK